MKKTVLIGVFFKIQVKFAAALGVSEKKVSAWEHGKATPDETETEKIRGGEVKTAPEARDGSEG